ncbi:LPXTG cell wall anchor domain-containing protein [Micromonospora sp. NPDC049497]|uniref:LPXTG cell wall anchor domain-containing protein n=1 Tax=Micromonospora sp. NPDC049497 TaxID=3364273 RepID=UPI00378D67DE
MPQRRRVARAAVSTAAAAACLTLATPAWASSTAPLHPDHKGSTAAGFETKDCNDEQFEKLPADHDGWHFVLPTKEGGNFEAVTLTFKSTAGTTVTVKLPDASDPYTDFFVANGGDGQVKHAYVFTPAGWTLVDGTATVSGTADRFNLSHTCAGGGTPGTPTPTTPVPTTPGNPGESENPGGSGTPTPGTGGGGGSEDDGGLPVTGVAGTSIALAGLALIGGGVALTVLRRRRDSITFTS